jgi:hypothetical protein
MMPSGKKRAAPTATARMTLRLADHHPGFERGGSRGSRRREPTEGRLELHLVLSDLAVRSLA